MRLHGHFNDEGLPMTTPATSLRSGHTAGAPSSRGLFAGRRGRELRNFLLALGFLSPSLIVFTLFVFVPLLRSVQLSVHGTNLIGQMRDFIGLENYQRMFADPEFYNSLRVSIVFAFYSVIFTVLLSLGLALLGNIRVRGITAFRTFFSSTIAVSAATASVIFLFLFNLSIGIFNYMLDLLRLPRVPWLTDMSWALFAVSMVRIWLGLGLNTIIILAGMQGIPDELYEAARIDGAAFWSQFRNVTLPLLSPTLFFLIVIDTLAALQTFTEINVMTRGGPVNATNTLVYSIYRQFYFNGSYGYAAAQSVVLLFIMLVFTSVQFFGLERRVYYQ
jgi:sn-glycerol 3-phosphate transport system permease protein